IRHHRERRSELPSEISIVAITTVANPATVAALWSISFALEFRTQASSHSPLAPLLVTAATIRHVRCPEQATARSMRHGCQEPRPGRHTDARGCTLFRFDNPWERSFGDGNIGNSTAVEHGQGGSDLVPALAGSFPLRVRVFRPLHTLRRQLPARRHLGPRR